MVMKAFVIEKPEAGSVRETSKPILHDNELLIQVDVCGICGTDVHIFLGDYLGTYPVIPGHEFAGTVVDTGSAVTRFQLEDRVTVEPNISCGNCYNCLNNRQNFCTNWEGLGVTKQGAMAQYIAVPETNVFPIGELPFEEAAFVEPLSSVIHGMRKVSISPGDHLLIFGAGPIGQLMLKLGLISGASEITVLDVNPYRRSIASRNGAQRTIADLEEAKPDEYDIVIDATGSVQVMRHAVDLVREGGKILYFGVPPMNSKMEVEPFKIFRKGLHLFGSYTDVRNVYQAIRLLQAGSITVDDLVSHRLDLDDLEDGIRMIENKSDNIMKILIYPDGKNK